MIAALALLVFAGAAIVAVSVIAWMVAPKWRRIVRLASGQVEPPAETDRWRRVHIEADRRATFSRQQSVRADGAGRRAR